MLRTKKRRFAGFSAKRLMLRLPRGRPPDPRQKNHRGPIAAQPRETMLRTKKRRFAGFSASRLMK